MGWIAVAAASPGYIGSKGHKSTDKRGMRDQEQADRERFKKEMENPKERFQREAAKRDALKGKEPPVEKDKDREVKEAVREFTEARQAEKSSS